CHPILHQRLLAAKARRGTRIITIDPRRTASCADADLHLTLAPGSDVALFNALLVHLAETGALDHRWLAVHASGLEAALEAARPSAARVAELTDVSAADIARFFDWFTATPRTVTLYSQGINQSSAGTDKVNAILNCHLA